MTSSPVTLAQLQAVISDDSSFARAYGFRVEAAEGGECTLFVPFNPQFERPGGIVNGVLLMAAADVAMWLAIKTLRGLDDPSVTINMHTSFLRSARREDIRCQARVLRWGGRLSHGTAECRAAASGDLLTEHSLTYTRAGRSSAPTPT
jgi:acyl-coenzyme A thioesterase PaaI-like protein